MKKTMTLAALAGAFALSIGAHAKPIKCTAELIQGSPSAVLTYDDESLRGLFDMQSGIIQVKGTAMDVDSTFRKDLDLKQLRIDWKRPDLTADEGVAIERVLYVTVASLRTSLTGDQTTPLVSPDNSLKTISFAAKDGSSILLMEARSKKTREVAGRALVIPNYGGSLCK